MTTGERIKEVRNQLGISQVDFADKINVSKQTLYKYENNMVVNIPFNKIEAIAQLANVSPDIQNGKFLIRCKCYRTRIIFPTLRYMNQGQVRARIRYA